MTEFLRGTVTPKDWIVVAVMLAVTGLIAVGFVALVYADKQAAITTYTTENGALQAKLTEYTAKARNIEQLRQQGEKYKKLVEDFEKRLPQTREIPRLASKFDELTQQNELVSFKIEPQPSQRGARKETIPYKITVEGDFHQIANYINSLERFERYVKISDLTIGEQKGFVSVATFTVSTYRIIESTPQPTAQPAAPQPAGA